MQEQVLSVGAIEVEITTPQTDPDDPSPVIGSDTIFTLPLDEDGTDSKSKQLVKISLKIR